MNKEDIAVRLQDVHKTYMLGQVKVKALQGISLNVGKSEFTVIVGRSGSGKTTLLNLIGCLDNPTSGIVEVFGHQMDNLSDNKISDFRAENIGFIFQNFNLIPVLSAFENIEYPLLIKNIPAKERRDKVMTMLQGVGIEENKNQRPSELSGGQRQRVAIARALIKSPGVVLADEPTANLDTKTSNEIIDLMQKMQVDHNTTFVFSTHDKKVMERAGNVFEIEDGILISQTAN